MPTHLRQSPYWSAYMQTIQWQIHQINQNVAISRNIPVLNRSIIKISRPNSPLTPANLDQLAQQTKALSIIIEPPLQDIHNQDLIKSGFRPSKTAYAQTATMQLNLAVPEQSLLQSFSENARRQIKKATKQNLHLTEVSFEHEFNTQAFDQFWQLWENLCDTKHFYKLSKPEMHDKLTALAPISHLLFVYPTPNDPDPIAVVWYVIYDQVIYYLHTGITQQGYDLSANYLLVWEGLKFGQRHNCHTLDFEGLYDPRLPQQTKRWKGFSEFKSRFHGQEIYYPLPIVKIYHPIFKAFFYLGELVTPP